MGYHTKFQGVLKFTKELKGSQIAYLNNILGVDFRDTRKLTKLTPGKDGEIASLTYAIDLELTDSFDGLKWDGSEKSYCMEEQVNFVLNYMKLKYPMFGLTGYLNAQGEDVDDRWRLEIIDQNAVRITTPPKGTKIQCPHCEEYFYIDGAER